MKLLIDTHVLIWWVGGSQRISKAARAAILAPEAELYASAVSAWEYMMKLRRDRLPLKVPFEMIVRRMRLTTLPLEYRQHTHAFTLPDVHRDPFDRMLIAQALDHGMTIVTNDRAINSYPVATLW